MILFHVFGHCLRQFIHEFIQVDVIDRGFDSQVLNLLNYEDEDVIEAEP
jgi:hypothetical protein